MERLVVQDSLQLFVLFVGERSSMPRPGYRRSQADMHEICTAISVIERREASFGSLLSQIEYERWCRLISSEICSPEPSALGVSLAQRTSLSLSLKASDRSIRGDFPHRALVQYSTAAFGVVDLNNIVHVVRPTETGNPHLLTSDVLATMFPSYPAFCQAQELRSCGLYFFRTSC